MNQLLPLQEQPLPPSSKLLIYPPQLDTPARLRAALRNLGSGLDTSDSQ